MKKIHVIILLVTAALFPLTSFAHKNCKRWQNIMVGFPNDKGDVTFNLKMREFNRKGWKLVTVKHTRDYITVFLYKCTRR